MAQQTAMLGRVMLVLEREGVSLRANGGSQQEQDKYNPPAPARPSCHAHDHTKKRESPQSHLPNSCPECSESFQLLPDFKTR
jgi:hypothetical protein